MIRNLILVGVLLGLTLLGFRWLTEGSHLIALSERYASPNTAALVEYYTGQAFFAVQDYDNAGRYFKYVMTRFPSSTYAEPASVFWLECRSQHLYSIPAQAVADCKTFLERYPKSVYAPRVQKILERCEQAVIH